MKNKEEYHISKLGKILTRASVLNQEKGLPYILKLGAKLILNQLANYFWCYLIYKPFKSFRTFTFQGKRYHYFYHTYNTAWGNERAVEIPIILEMMGGVKSGEILEVGNVLSHYIKSNHNVLDKYEKSQGVINQDVIDFRSDKKYKLIICVSTIEHVGWDEQPRDDGKIPKALENLKSLLTQSGKIVVTFPLGYNLNLDNLVKNNSLNFTNMYCLKRISEDNTWQETSYEDIRNTKYGDPLDSLIIGTIEKV